MIRSVPLAVLVAAVAALDPFSLATPLRAQGGDRITYDGVEIRPGDVINFVGGGVTAASAGAAAALGGIAAVEPLRYGHTGLYLGIDPQKRQRTFLDYTTTKDPSKPFVGRILSEEAFLAANATSHATFDVFRLDDLSTLEQSRMLLEAKRISIQRTKWENNWGIANVCVSAVTEVLSKATGRNISFLSPDRFMQPPFHKLPELQNRSIDIPAALRQARATGRVDTRATELRRLAPRVAVAQRRALTEARRTSLTAEEFAALTESRRQRLLDAQWDYLRTLVGYACSDPGNLRTLNDSGRVPGVSLNINVLRVYLDVNRRDLSRCESEVFSSILAADHVAPVESLIEWGVAYRETHGPHVVVQKLLNALKACGAEIGRAFASLGQEESGSGSIESDSSSRSSITIRDSSTLHDLRGINASGAWPK